jgi:hypothetical protein
MPFIDSRPRWRQVVEVSARGRILQCVLYDVMYNNILLQASLNQVLILS